MGCGKSSVGRKLSELLCWPFVDLDAAIEEISGLTIPEIFASEGEAGFRNAELETLRGMLPPTYPNMILSLGGGTVMTPQCAEIIKNETCCIYLRTSVDTLVERLADEAAGRPLLSGTQNGESAESALHSRIETLMAKRASTYEATATHIIDTDGLSVETIAKHLVHMLK